MINQKNDKEKDALASAVDAIVMWPLLNGLYETKNGSTVEIFGKHSGAARVSFDWLEEGACIDCKPNPYPEEWDTDDVRMVWDCDYCAGGNAKLHKVT